MKSLTLMLNAALIWGSISAQGLEKVLADYIVVKNNLVAGNAENAAASAQVLVSSLEQLKLKSDQPAVIDEIISSANAIAKTENIEKQRTALSTLSASLWKLAEFYEATERQYFYSYCPMKKMHWISETKEVRNPFYGKQMLSCGKVEETLN